MVDNRDGRNGVKAAGRKEITRSVVTSLSRNNSTTVTSLEMPSHVCMEDYRVLKCKFQTCRERQGWSGGGRMRGREDGGLSETENGHGSDCLVSFNVSFRESKNSWYHCGSVTSAKFVPA